MLKSILIYKILDIFISLFQVLRQLCLHGNHPGYQQGQNLSQEAPESLKPPENLAEPGIIKAEQF